MFYFLLVFDRPKGEILLSEPYRSSADALRARFKQERKYRTNPDIEVVVLGADSMESLRRTHSRYFRNVTDLAAALPTDR